MPLPLQKPLQVSHQQCPGGPGCAPHRPRRAQCDIQQIAVGDRAGVVGLLDFDERALAAQKQFVGPEGEGPRDPVALVAWRLGPEGADADIVELSCKHLDRVGNRRAAAPLFHDARIPRSRERAWAKIGGHEDAVQVPPAQPALGLREHKPVCDKDLLCHVELARHRGVGPAARQRQQAAVVRRFQAIAALPDPVFLFGRRQRIQIEHHLPLRVVLAIGLERRPPPHPARVLRVAPKVVIVVPRFGDERNPRVRVEDLQQAMMQSAERVVLRQRGRALRIPFLHPRQCLVPRDLFQPQMRIVVFLSADRQCQ